MQATVATKLTIAASPAEVFEYLADLKYHYLWNPQVRTISTNEKLKLGMQYNTESTVLGATIKATNTVKVFNPPSELVLENPLGNVCYTAKFKLTPQANGKKTAVQLSVKVSTNHKAYVFTAPVLKQLALRELRTDLQALKVAVENSLN